MRTSNFLPILAVALTAPTWAQGSRAPERAVPQPASPKAPSLDAPDPAVEKTPAFVSRPASIGDRDLTVAERGTPFYLPAVAPNPKALTDAEIASQPRITSQPPAMIYYTEHTDGLWIRGQTYKARASESGFTYIPFLGSKAPKNYPTSFRLASATADGRSLNLTDKAVVQRAGDRLVLDRGPIDVLYDMDLDSVEQSFRFDATGVTTDLVLDLDVSTELDIEARGEGFGFDGPHGGFHYSAAVVFDDAGRSDEVPATLVGGRLRLTVPAAFVAAANGPIVVDPVLTTYSIDEFMGDQGNVDAAYSIMNDGFTYVYEDDFSGSDVDIFSTTVDSFGVFVANRYLESSADNAYEPRIATVANGNVHLAVYSRQEAGTSNFDVVGRVLNLSVGTLGAQFTIDAGTSTYRSSAPDVGGQFSASGSQFCVVWERFYIGQDADVHRALVSTAGVITNSSALEVTFDRSESGIEVSESAGDPATVNLWNVAYRSEDVTTGDQTLRVLQMNTAGAVLSGPSDVSSSPVGVGSYGELDVSDALSLDGLAPTYLVTYDLYSTLDDDNQVLICRGSSAVNLVNLVALEHAPIPLDQAECRLSTTAEDFVVTYFERPELGSDHRVFSTALDLTEGSFLAISERRELLGFTGSGYAGGAGVASRFSGGNTTSRYVGVGWAQFDTDAGEYDIQGATYFASNGDSPAFQYCYGNPNSTGDRGFIAMYGSRSATTSKTLVASALPPNSFGYFITGRGMTSVPNPGGSEGVLCIGGTIGRYSNLAASSGSSGSISISLDPTMLSQPSGPVAALPGDIWNFQLWHRDSISGVPTSNFTNAVTILFN